MSQLRDEMQSQLTVEMIKKGGTCIVCSYTPTQPKYNPPKPAALNKFHKKVEEKLDPSLRGKPIAVVQYNPWQGGGIIAVNYLARAKGVSRHMRGDQAKKACPEIELPTVPCVRGKADTSKYREAGKEVARVLAEFTPLLERASVDEAYLDITQAVNDRMNTNDNKSLKAVIETLSNTYISGYDSLDGFVAEVYNDNSDEEFSNFDRNHSMKLLVGAIITSEIRSAVFEKTGYRCSAGIAHNKIMAKLVCGMNKPNKQTVLPKSSISVLFQNLPLSKVRSLGGKFGEQVCQVLTIKTMYELMQFSERDLQKRFDEKNGSWLYNIARGIDHDPVVPKFNSKSIGCCKKFPGKAAITDLTTLTHWLKELGSEIEDRLKGDIAENNRYPTQMVVSFTKNVNGKDAASSRSINMIQEEISNGESLALNALSLIRKDCKPFCNTEVISCEGVEVIKVMLVNHVKYLGISVGKFEEQTSNEKKGKNIQELFNAMKKKEIAVKESFKVENDGNVPNKNSELPIKMEITESPRKSPTLTTVAKSTPTKLPPESFIAKYLKSFSKSASSEHLKPTEPNIESTSIKEENSDSECSIESEINKSKCFEDDTSNDRIRELENLRISLQHSICQEENTSPPTVHKVEAGMTCDECKKVIPEKEYETHKDYHLALSLRETDRLESRKNTALPIHSNSKSSKSQTLVKGKNNSNLLLLFNKLKEQNYECDDGEICSECGKTIEISKMPEHMDYHEAKKLHAELNKPPTSQSTAPQAVPGKRKRDPKDSNPNAKKINAYFK